jgi:hypothetical protein
VLVPVSSSSRAAVTSAPYAAHASDPPVDTRRTPTPASSGTDGPAGSARTFTGAPVSVTTRAMSARSRRPGA